MMRAARRINRQIKYFHHCIIAVVDKQVEAIHYSIITMMEVDMRPIKKHMVRDVVYAI